MLTPKEILQKALESFGPNGENWVKTASQRGTERCMVTAIGNVLDSCAEEYITALQTLHEVVLRQSNTHAFTSNFNDDPATTFADVKAVYQKAIDSL